MKQITRHIILMAISFFLTLLIGRGYIFSEGYIYLAEQFEVYTVDGFLRVIYPIWNEQLQTNPLTGVSKLYIYFTIVTIARIIDSYKLLQSLMIFLPCIIGFISSFKLIEHLIAKIMDEEISINNIFISAIVGAFIFIINPWFAMNPRNISFRFSYALLPLLIYTYIRLLESKNVKYTIYFAGIMSLIGGYRSIILFFLMLGIIFLVYIIFSRNLWRVFISRLWLSFSAYSIFILFSLTYLLPSILYSQYVPIKAVVAFTFNNVQRETLFHIFTTKIYEWTASGFDLTYDDMMHFLFIFNTIFSYTYLLYGIRRKKEKYFYLFFPALLSIVFVFITAKEINLDPIILRLPASNYLGRLLRHARWNIMPVLISISIMAGFSSAFLISKLKGKAYPILLFIMVIASLSAWPLFNGDMNGYWRPAKPPEDYIKTNEILSGQGGETHALWLPPSFFDRRASWSNQSGLMETTAVTGLFPVLSSVLPSYNPSSFYFFDYFTSINPYLSPLPIYSGGLSDIYSPLNIKYLILHSDIDTSENGYINEIIKQAADSIDESTWAEKIYTGKYVSAFELNNDAKEFEVRKILLVYGGLGAIGSIDSFIDSQMPAIVFKDASINIQFNESNYDLLLINENNKPNLPLSDRNIISPKDFSKEFDPRARWSPSTVSNPSFQKFIHRENIEWNWDFDYGEGLVFTYATECSLNLSKEIQDQNYYKLFIRFFSNQKGGLIEVSLNDKRTQIYTKDQLNGFTWKDLGTFHLDEGTNQITLKNIEGFNAVNLFALVPVQEYREAENRLTEALQDKRIIHVLEAETDLYHNNTITTNKYGAEASNGEALELAPDSTTWREIEIAKPDDYTVVVRGKGNLNIKIDEETYQTNTSQLDWTYLQPIYLEVGTHRIEITQHTSQSRRWDFEDNATSQWTATSPTNQTLTLTKNPHGAGISLKTEFTESTTSWKTVTTPLILATPEAIYTWNLQVAGENAYEAHINILEYDENRNPLTAIQVASLASGNYTWTPVSIQYTPTPDAAHIALQIWHGHESTQPLPNRIWVDDVQITGRLSTDLDVVWIYSTDKPGETLQDIFTVDQTPAQLIEYKKIDPTKYKATINASKPFMLCFAESYDPLWITRVNGEKISSTPLYSVINGFWIQETGLIDVNIEYEPQRWFYIGSAISITTLTASLAYLTKLHLQHKGITLKTIISYIRKYHTSK